MAFVITPAGPRRADVSPDMRPLTAPEPPPLPSPPPARLIPDEAVAEIVRRIDERAAARKLADQRRKIAAEAEAVLQRLAAAEARHGEASRRCAELTARPTPTSDAIAAAVGAPPA